MANQKAKQKNYDVRDLLTPAVRRALQIEDLRIIALRLAKIQCSEIAKTLEIDYDHVITRLEQPEVEKAIKQALDKIREHEIAAAGPILIGGQVEMMVQVFEPHITERISNHLQRCTHPVVMSDGSFLPAKWTNKELSSTLAAHPISDDKYWFVNDLFMLCQAIFPDISVEPHSDVCRFIEYPGDVIDAQEYFQDRSNFNLVPVDELMVGFRGSLKSSIAVAYALQLGLQNPDIRILYVQNNFTNAKGTLKQLQGIFERNERISTAFPEIIPGPGERGRGYKWSAEELCLKRKQDFKEPTYKAAGSGTNLTSLHFNIIILDDIVTAKKDDISDVEIRPNPKDIAKAIGWHKVSSYGLLERKPTHRGSKDKLFLAKRMYLNNRWADNDFVDYIETNDSSFTEFVLPVYWPDDYPVKEMRGEPSWPSGTLGTMVEIVALEESQNSYIFNTQYLCLPTDPAENVFKKEWILHYAKAPEMIDIVGMMDLGLSQDKSACYTTGLIVGVDAMNNWYILDAVRGQFDTGGQLDMFFNLAEHWRPSTFAMEDVLFQAKMLDIVRMDARFKSLCEWGVGFTGIHPYKNEAKVQRIEALQPRFRNGMIHLKHNQKALYNELIRYRRNGTGICDLVDSLAYIPRLLIGPDEPKKEIVYIDEPSFVTYEDIEREFFDMDSEDLLDPIGVQSYD